MEEEDFVELPEEAEQDGERHAAFLDRQVEAYRAKISAKKARRKAALVLKKHDDENDQHEDHVVDHDAVAVKQPKRKKEKRTRPVVVVEEPEEEKNDEDDGDDDDDDGDESVPVKKIKNTDTDDELSRKLAGARFRLLNEQLYSIKSGEAVSLFGEHPDLFSVYHRGFAEQVAKWPENPLNHYIALLRKHASAKKLVVADFGCGEGRLGLELKKAVRQVHSFDLVAQHPHVTACDMAHTPLKENSVDVAIFCLALMGTNWEDFVREANRVLKLNGQLLVTEVTSRIQDNKQFVAAVKQLGFNFVESNESNSHFVRFVFSKNNKPPKTKPSGFALGVCKYKKR